MIRASVRPQPSFCSVLILCFTAIVLSGSIATAQGTAPTITNSSSATFVIGTLGSFTVTTTGSPAPNITVSGPLPNGVIFRDNRDGTATFGGTPTVSGVFNITLTATNGVLPDANQSFTLTVNQTSAMAAARFLEQSSWGPTPATIAQVQAAGLPAYLQQQFSAPVSAYTTPQPEKYFTLAELVPVQNNFFVNAMQGQDQLRQRVAFALSQIMVISAVGPNIKSASAFSLWANMMQTDAFGNFFNLLNDVTISPGMGSYLNLAKNNGCATRCRPNENYGREVLQLFTIGLYELNIDGTPVLDQNGSLIPTYGQDTIDGFGEVFTGWSYPTPPGDVPKFFIPHPYYGGPMIPFQPHYSQASKLLLNGTTIAPNGNIQTDLVSALQNIFTHPNVAPFISGQLIQKLVTSNPSPAYVTRVAQVFNNDGTGIEGNLQAVVTAILLDPEARRGDDPAQVQSSDGHLREPLLSMMTAMRAVNTTTDGVNLNNYGSAMNQAPFLPGSVFSFYPPNYQVQGTQLIGPEFKILDASAAIARVNWINDLIYGSVGPNTTIDISPYVAVAGNVSSLLAMINANVMHGQMPSDMYNTLFSTLSSPEFTSPTTTAQAALYLVLSSSLFQMEH
jgi:uncharacterized protein (DUF1800 family)